MEAILFGMFIGALMGGAAVVVVQGIIANRKAAAWAKHVEENERPPLPNIMRHNNLAWMEKGGASE